MTPAEKKAYGKGYAAGRRSMQQRLREELQAKQRTSQRNAFYNRALLAAIKPAMTVPWDCEGKKMISVTDRMSIADSIASEALKYFRPVS